ncbi:hypothetical protein SERLA73DRAFT_181649 [Serpula lacrymans var. lacrymans S7.3]|uniref:Uncharacterized protein n=2 Tax=Serpula lacrymans var. lacrymans TaxID=341189 RepID=F8PYF9_SERL3|nr:uncharacterized protein SERLADRAFT_467945 [Serpula lacrymans var. lacrymans S7.9]EGN98922.1 hypothetical protein SERLA73DRAFT_181649 [Serpula lacrymans var. lacrymans S7.3]EGO24510.1 hypothetical protein SERLADRAFT_467945 [Serpula lacrymans var. lacrymans S7.9]
MSFHNPKNKVLRKRQDGIFGSETAAVPTATSLGVNTAEPGSNSFSAIPLATTGPTDTSVATPSSSPTSSPAASSTSSPSSSSSNIPIGTVIGACVGAFAALALVIILAVWYNRRSSKPAASRQMEKTLPSPSSRNADNNYHRRRSHMEIWDKLDDSESQEQGHTKRVASTGPMEKLGAMFKRTPSTTSGEKSSEGHGVPESITPMQLAKYHPNLAEEMASLPARPFMGRAVVEEPAISWGGETVADQSFLSLRSGVSVRESMSPTIAMAKSTPPATSSEPHRWESAEVMHYDETYEAEAEDEESNNPYTAAIMRKRSTSNPFFNAQENKKSINPFADAYAATVPRNLGESNTESTISVTSNDRAMQSLIAALQVSPEEVEQRLRVASMQPSFYSRTSTMMTTDEEDITSMTSFPLPPTQVPRGGEI